MLGGERASEASLRQFAAPRLLHIATHGFFLQYAGIAPKAGAPESAGGPGRDPLLRAGLALARANIRGGTDPDDGVLTALEASRLNLWGTRLVALSACDTGVGEVRNGDGVYGLRRAFVLAGAESLLMSLWPVSDTWTERQMRSYYQQSQARKRSRRIAASRAARHAGTQSPPPSLLLGQLHPVRRLGTPRSHSRMTAPSGR